MTPSDLFLSPDLSEADAQQYLLSLGFREAAAVDRHLQQIADDLVAREAMGRLAPELLHALLESPDPDAAAAGVAHYVSARTGRAMFLDYLKDDPKALHVLTHVMGGSPILGEILVRTPEYFHWLVSQIERSAPDRQDHEEELSNILATIDDAAEALDVLRRWKRRELLRIGARELLRFDGVQAVAAQLSDLASVAIEFAVAIITQRELDEAGAVEPPGAFAVIATHRLGGFEMSYDAELHLLYVYEPSASSSAEESQAFYDRLAAGLTAALREETSEGRMYEVAAMPDGSARPVARPLGEYLDRYTRGGSTAERIALAGARHVAGDGALGERFVTGCRQFVFAPPLEGRTVASILQAQPAGHAEAVDALARALQIVHGARHPAVRGGGTAAALQTLGRTRLMPEEVCQELSAVYTLFRTAEHRRQLGSRMDDLERQLADSGERLAALRQQILRTL